MCLAMEHETETVLVLESAARLLDELEVTAHLPETPAGSRAMLRDAADFLAVMLPVVQTGGPQGVNVATRVATAVRELTDQQLKETHTGCRATVRRMANMLAAVGEELDRAKNRRIGK